ncbi:serine/threonine protein phosphatase [Streptomyces abyssalis]|uniref:Serine/threonine protein phosphatase n=1 Tax=Streptomyces abyssalis TaxID=933944 RepID=A0A1E7JKC9_9ACTN|nr:ATP-binding protein [Streptomyces abyssalis]OEU88097.1 serine/threonine protein phosphatase [Streptomyces abyssalis]OEU90968.1 serine/threonine protein phosphatase [Streptomyces abyssalis]OEV30776.1 serine/threonine protein phosphatase [Streptomyces nanshensis]
MPRPTVPHPPTRGVVARPTGHPGYSETLPRTPGSVATARSLVRTALATWGLEQLADAAVLVASELVTNAVQHARSDALRVVVTRPCAVCVRVAVVDKSRTLPTRCEAAEDDEGGRGLALVERLAVRWDTDPLPWGKCVWAELEAL